MNLQLNEAQKNNFNTLGDAFKAERVALVSCTDAKTGELVPTICAVNELEDGEIELVPFARLFDGDPYEQLLPPPQGN